MARTRKSWQQKLDEARAKNNQPRYVRCDRSSETILIPPVADIEATIGRIPDGKLMTMKQVTDLLASKHGADTCCPLTTGIFTWVIAHAVEDQPAGSPRLPWWRIVKADGELNLKYPGDGNIQRERLEAEGHIVTAKGKRLIVEHHECALFAPAS